MQTKHAVFLSVSVALSLVVGCTERDPTYCDENIPCDPGYWCNLENNTCYPVDGGVQPDGFPDLGLDAPAPDQAPPPDSAADLTTDGNLLPRGTACTGDAQCATGHCVDGFCCETKCDGICRTCALAGDEGTCNLTLQGQDPDQECKGTVAACDGTCDGQGACTFPDATQSCGAPKCTAGAMETFQCDGSGGCSSSSTDCGGYTCNAAGDACNTSCSGPTDCTGNAQCIGGKCVNSLPLGAACGTNNSACASGFCADGVCCNSACPGTCMACNLTGKAGTCSAVPNGQDPDGECAGTDPACGGTCNGSGACTYAPTSTQCKSPFCSSGTLTTYNCDGSGDCKGTSSSCNGYACASSTTCKTSCVSTSVDCTGAYQCVGGKCVVNLPNGTACEGNNLACASGMCVDGVCCNSACTGTCQACNVSGKLGTCSPIPSGQDPANECAGTDPACGGTCNGSGACAYAPTSTVCKTPSCSGGNLTTYNCDGSGGCNGTTTSCNGYACASATACKTSCTSTSTDCTGGYQCVGGKCVINLPIGSSCGTNNLACASGHCVDGVCCNSACSSSCQACNLTGKEGTCSDLSNGTVCGTATCNVNIFTTLTCQGGTCTPSSTTCPNSLKCNASGCLASCSTPADCVSKPICASGKCMGLVSVASGTTNNLYGLWGQNAGDIWAVGANGTSLHYNGSSWNSVSTGVTAHLSDVWGSESDYWAVGGGGTILRSKDLSWNPETSGVTSYLQAIWGQPTASEIWAVGNCAELLYRSTSWQALSFGFNHDYLYGIWGLGPELWAVGESGTILYFGAGKWKQVTPITTEGLYGAWANSSSNVWVVGSNGKIVHWNGGSWSSVASGTTQHLSEVFGTSSTDVWAVGANGTVVHYNGTSWSPISSGTTAYLKDVWGTSPTNIWIVGYNGTILHTE